MSSCHSQDCHVVAPHYHVSETLGGHAIPLWTGSVPTEDLASLRSRIAALEEENHWLEIAEQSAREVRDAFRSESDRYRKALEEATQEWRFLVEQDEQRLTEDEPIEVWTICQSCGGRKRDEHTMSCPYQIARRSVAIADRALAPQDDGEKKP